MNKTQLYSNRHNSFYFSAEQELNSHGKFITTNLLYLEQLRLYTLAHAPIGPNLEGSKTWPNKVENNFQYILMKQS